MENKKLIILIVLSVFAVFSLVRGMVVPPQRKRKRKSISAPAPIKKEELSPRIKKGGSALRRSKRTDYASWGRNPFTLAPTKASSMPKLDGVLWTKDAPKAVINGNLVGIGDKVGTVTVIAIKKDRVVLNDGTKEFELRLGR